MSQRELGRVEVLARVRSQQLRVVDAARLMRLSYRQAKRLWKRYREQGAAGLKHGSAGRISNRAHDAKFRRKVLHLVREKYGGPVGERFGPTLAAEHLASEDGLQVDAETLRRWMLAEGLWSRERKRRRHRQRRARKEHFGEMVQMDGSFHAWLEERGPEGCLIDMVDDATNTTWAQLGEQEPITQFGRMCAKLGIELIAASSPQAKGRVERIHGTHQDRLVKKLRRKQISSHEQANVYLQRDYLPEHNQRFGRAAAKPEDYHRRAPRAAELDRIFRLETERTISQDWVVRYQNRFFQLEPQSRHYAPAQDQVLVCEGRHGSIVIEYRDGALRWREIPAPAKPIFQQAAERPTRPSPPRAQPKWVPPAEHPWRQAVRREMQKRASKLAAVAARPPLAWPSASP